MANSINYTTRKANGAEVTKNISNVNPAAADSDVAVFVAHVASLSDNTLTAIEKVVTADVNIVPDNVLYATSRAVSIINSNLEQIYTGEYNDVIRNSLDAVTISTGKGNDSITNTGDYVSISAGTGDDSITNTGDYVSISAGKGDDSITNEGDNVFIDAGYGSSSNTINNSGANVTLQVKNVDVINNTATDTTIVQKYYICSESENYTNTASNVSVIGSNSTNSITNSGDSVYCGIGSITNSGDHVTLENAYYFNNSGNYCSLEADRANLYLNTGQHCTLFCDNKNTTIDTSAHGYQMIGQADKKIRTNKNEGTYSLCTAEGNNTILLNYGKNTTVNVYGFNQNSDVLYIYDTISAESIEGGTKINTLKNVTNLYGVTSGTVRYQVGGNTTYDPTVEVQLLNLNPENENSAMPDDENLFIADI